MRRDEAESVVSSLVGSQPPSEGDTLIRRRKNWGLTRLYFKGVVAADPTDVQSGDAWFNSTDSMMRVQVGANIYEVALTLKP